MYVRSTTETGSRKGCSCSLRDPGYTSVPPPVMWPILGAPKRLHPPMLVPSVSSSSGGSRPQQASPSSEHPFKHVPGVSRAAVSPHPPPVNRASPFFPWRRLDLELPRTSRRPTRCPRGSRSPAPEVGYPPAPFFED